VPVVELANRRAALVERVAVGDRFRDKVEVVISSLMNDL